MSKSSARCQHELCLQEPDSTPMRVYRCRYHCWKMLCITHLCEHDQCLTKQSEYRNKLGKLQDDYMKIFNEDEKELNKLKLEYENAQLKYENHLKIHDGIVNVLSIKNFPASMANNEELQKTIETVEEAIEQENLSKSMTYATSHGNQNNNVNVSTIEIDADPEVTNNDQGNSAKISIVGLITQLHYLHFQKTRFLAWLNHGEKLSVSENTSMEIPNISQREQTNNFNEQPAIMNTTAPSDELSTPQNISTPYQGALQRLDSTDSSESSEKSCY